MELDLKEYQLKIGKLSINEQKLRDLYLRDLALGIVQGPPTGYASIDKPWLQNYSKEEIIQIFPNQTMFQHIYERNKDNLDSYALNYFGKRITYRELFEQINKVEESFRKLNINKNDIVSFCMPTTPETIYCLYALNKIGAIANMIDLTTNNENILKRINDTNSKCLIMLDSLEEKMNDIVGKLNVQEIVSVSPTNSLSPIISVINKIKSGKIIRNKKYLTWKQFIKNNDTIKENNIIEKIDENNAAIIIYTSGTTGTPKGSVLGNKGINSTIWQLKNTNIHSDVGDKYLDIMPPFIAYGIVCGIHNPLSERQEIIIIPKLEPKKFAKYIKKYKPNHIIGVPALFETMSKSSELKTKDLSFIKNLICGGDRLTIASEKQINDFLNEHKSNAKVAQGFGMTEVGTSVTYTMNNTNESTNNHIGCPLSATNIKIVKPGTEEELTYNEKGEICISTPSHMLGYFNNISETNNVLKKHSDGKMWIHSQDLGYISENGELYFIDRMKRMIIRHDGHNVWPGAIEEIISKHYAVENCVVIGIPTIDNTNGVIPTAVIVLKEKYKNDAQKIILEIDELCKKMLPERDKAQNYIIRDFLPKTSIGKIDFKSVEDEEIHKIKKLKK